MPSMLSSEDNEDIKYAVSIILKIRGNKELGDMSVRPRKTPKLKLNATTLKTLITLKIVECDKPVFTCKMTKEELNECLDTDPSKCQNSLYKHRVKKDVLNL